MVTRQASVFARCLSSGSRWKPAQDPQNPERNVLIDLFNMLRSFLHYKVSYGGVFFLLSCLTVTCVAAECVGAVCVVCVWSLLWRQTEAVTGGWPRWRCLYARGQHAFLIRSVSPLWAPKGGWEYFWVFQGLYQGPSCIYREEKSYSGQNIDYYTLIRMYGLYRPP